MKILVVDDERFIRTLCGRMLECMGHEMIEAESIMQGWEMLYEHEDIGLVLTDFNIPDQRGKDTTSLELLENAQKRGINTPFILMTGGNEINEQTARQAGFRGFLNKPFAPSQLQEQIEKVTGGKR